MQDFKTRGICPKCESEGPEGTSCARTTCIKRGYHHIPASRLREDELTDPLVGLMADGYLLLERIGSGAFGRVYLAEQSVVGVRAAIKVLTLDDVPTDQATDRIAKFQGEARAMSQLSHPNIVRVYRYGVFQGGPFLALEFIDDARTLADEMDLRETSDRWFSLDESRIILTQLLDALDAAHDKGIVHRDIKPENLMLQQTAGDQVTVRVLDFGIAKFMEEGDTTQHVIGTPIYMAPEQLHQRKIGPQTDLYAVAVLVCELLTGCPPFATKKVPEVFRQKVDPYHDPGEEIVSLGLSARHVTFFRRALAVEPSDRYASGAAFREAMLDLFAPSTFPPNLIPAPKSKPLPAAPPANAATFRNWLAREGERLAVTELEIGVDLSDTEN